MRMKRIRHKGIKGIKRKKTKKCVPEQHKREKHPQRTEEENYEFLCTYHSCELAYFNPSMTVLYI